MWLIRRRFDVDFRQLCDVLDTEKTKNRATVHTHDPLHMCATIGGLAIDVKRAEGIAAMEGVEQGQAEMMCVFFQLQIRCLIFLG